MRNPFSDGWQGLPEERGDDEFDAAALEDAIRRHRRKQFAELARIDAQ